MSWQSLTADQKYWQKIVEPLAEKNNLWWDVNLNYDLQTLTIKLLHKADAKGKEGIPYSWLISMIDGNREKRSEKVILNEVEREIAKRTKDR